ncbi:hypothetical protein N7453_004278 [Penicillium expansum]|nr:hypothetical protein N7453_004278 [Penicillium expansum]
MPDDRMDPHYTWPLVLLTDLCASSQANLTGLVKSIVEDDLKSHSDKYFGTSAQAKNATHNVNVNVRVWSPTRRLLGSIAQVGPPRDNQSNLYALAILAYRSGRPRIIVADETTKRQLSGKFLYDRDLYSIRGEGTSRSFSYPQIGIPTRTIYGAILILKEGGSNLFTNHGGPLWAHGQGWRGTMLHDPDEEPFKPGTANILGREYYAKAYLPTELAIQIANTNSDPIKMPIWDRRPSNTHLVIFLLYPTTPQELGNTYKKLEEVIPTKFFHRGPRMPITIPNTGFTVQTEEWYTEPHMTLEVVPWNKHRMKTRRDLINFWNEYRVWDAQLGRKEGGIMPLLCLPRPLAALDEAQFGVFTCKPRKPNILFVQEMKFFDICTDMEEWGYVRTSHEFDSRNKGAKEILCQPDNPFFIDPPLWLPIITTNWIRTVVFLTNQLSHAAKQTLKQLIVPPIEVDSDGSDYDSQHGDTSPSIRSYLGARTPL